MRFEDKKFEMNVTKPLKSMSENSDWDSLFLSAIVAEKVKWATTLQKNPELEFLYQKRAAEEGFV